MMFLSDHETTIDYLQYRSISGTIKRLLNSLTEEPVTIGVHGDWGAGKSSILKMLQQDLAKEDDVVIITVNSWQLQGFEDAKIALIEDILNQLESSQPKTHQYAEKARDLFRRINWLKVAHLTGSLVWTGVTGIPSPTALSDLKSGLSRLRSTVQDEDSTSENIELEFSNLHGLLKEAEPRNVPKEIKEFQQAFDDLLEHADIRQLVVLVDDMDRCLPETAISLLEAIRLFLMTRNTAFVIAADERMIEYAVRQHFPDTPGSHRHQDYARSYLEKLIQVPFRLPPLGGNEARIYVTCLMLEKELGRSSSEFKAVTELASRALQEPWKDSQFSHAEVIRILENNDHAKEIARVCERIAPILARNTQGNPRQIKRFLNSLILRLELAETRGFKEQLKFSVLAKLMLLERFVPQVYESIGAEVASSIDGISTRLQRAEKILTSKPVSTSKKGKKKKKKVRDATFDDTALAAWLDQEEFLEWAKLKPAIGDEDLRAYFFVSREQARQLPKVSGWNELEHLYELLIGPEETVNTVKGRLSDLSEGELSWLCGEVGTQVIKSSEGAGEPEGIYGLKALARLSDKLAAKALEVLESMAYEDLGTWAVAGWRDSFEGNNLKRRFNELLSRWASQETNNALKTAAIAATRASGKRS